MTHTSQRGLLEAIVFDFDGLVLDTETSSFTTAAEVFAAHGVELSLTWWSTIIGTAEHPHWSEILEAELGCAIADRDAVLAARTARHHELIELELLRPGVASLLDEADAAGIPVAIASSSPEQWVLGHVERLGLSARFATVRAREHAPRSKPAPDLYLAACAALDAAPAASVALEDSSNGVTAAKAAGLVCVAAPCAMTEGSDLSAADLIVGSLEVVDLAALRRLVAGQTSE
ncbi:MAG: HAD family hydrolase [Acidimicrobiales bacterium]